MNNTAKNKNRTLITLAAATAALLSGCYAVPVGPNGEVVVVTPAPTYPAQAPAAAPAPAWPATLYARLYPVNEEANATGVLTGTVTNLQTGKGRFALNMHGETLVGEATRVGSQERRGVANAYGRNGTYMSCEYLMNTPYQGTGTCTLSNGARYSVHVGS